MNRRCDVVADGHALFDGYYRIQCTPVAVGVFSNIHFVIVAGSLFERAADGWFYIPDEVAILSRLLDERP